MEADKYGGREQSYFKHVLLEAYLRTFAYKVGSWAKAITYVDGFAGPWKNKDEEFADTSFAIALRTLESVRKDTGGSFRTRFAFVEADPTAFAELQHFVQSRPRDARTEISAIHGSFEGRVQEVRDFINDGGRKNFAFILLDPKGFTGLSLDKLAPVLSAPDTEVLVNLMMEFLRRFPEEGLARLLGPEHAKVNLSGLAGLPRDARIVEAFRTGLARFGGYDFVTSAFIPHPDRARVFFHLVYGTRHIKGIEAFKQAEAGAIKAAKSVRSTLRRDVDSPDLPFGEVNERDELISKMETLATQHVKDLLSDIAPGASVPYDKLWKESVAMPLVTGGRLNKEIKAHRGLRLDGLKPNQRAGRFGQGHLVTRTH